MPASIRQGAKVTIKILRGNPTPEELAAALAVVHARTAAAAAAAGSEPPAQVNEWADKRVNIPRRTGVSVAPVSWRTTYWPR